MRSIIIINADEGLRLLMRRRDCEVGLIDRFCVFYFFFYGRSSYCNTVYYYACRRGGTDWEIGKFPDGPPPYYYGQSKANHSVGENILGLG